MLTPRQKLLLATTATALLVIALLVVLVLRLRAPMPTESNFEGSLPGPTGASSESLSTPPVGAEADLRSTSASTAPAALDASPRVEFQYELMTELPTGLPTALPVTLLAPPRTPQQVGELARALGIEGQLFPEPTRDVVIGRLDRVLGSGVLRVDRASGYWRYESIFLPLAPRNPVSRDEAVTGAAAFLQQRGLLPSDVAPPASYRREGDSIWYVEWHRPWTTLPILNQLGLLAADPTQEDPALGLLPDPGIVDASDGRDGIARGNDFNSLTVAVNSSGQVLFVDARLRPALRTTAPQQLLTPAQALDRLREVGPALSLVLPSDKNTTPLTPHDLLPDGVARSQTARIRRVTMALLEKGEGLPQQALEPVYTFVGEAKLDSGSLADFALVVSALSDSSTPLN